MKKRLIALLLTACMLISILPAGVFATDESETEGVLFHRQINPVYENVLSEEAKAQIFAELDKHAAQEPEETGDGLQDYMSESQLISTLKSKMIGRSTSVSAQFITTRNPEYDSTIYDLILKACAHDGVANHGDYIYWSLGGFGWSDPSCYSSGGYYYVTMTFVFSWNASADEESQVTNAVKNLIGSFGFNASTPTAYQIKTIYGWICNNVTYDYYHLNTDPKGYRIMYSAYGAIMKRTCVCQGYALLLYRLLLTIGVDCRIVTSEDHAWNIVKVGSYWYYADSTWDAGDPYEKWWYFLAGTRSFDQIHDDPSHVREDGTRYGGYDYRYGSDFDRAHPMAYYDYSMNACEINNHSLSRTTIQAPSAYENGTCKMVCTRCGFNYTEVIPCTGYHPFTDLVPTEYYYAPVVWAFNTNITSGVTATSFQPNGNCTRAQFVSFLWRAAGYPEPDMGTTPFVDLNPSEYYYKAVLWAYENGITAGTTATTFSPNSTLNRAQVVAFLYRYNGEPGYTKTSSFTDVPKDWFYDAVMWAAETGITSGVSSTRFAPYNSCTRGQTVSFLYRNDRLAA